MLLRTARSLLIFAGAGLATAGCSLMPDALDMSTTGSIGPQPVAYTSEPVPKGIAPDDWAAARQALAEALHDKNTAPSVPWENNMSAARGTVTPLGAARPTQAGTCRDFLMSFVRAADENWLQGEACRTARGSWKVAQARLLARS